FSWKEAWTESREAVVITVGQKDWMADDIETPMDEAILSVIKAYTLLQWYKSTGQYQDAQIYAIDYDNAKIDLRTAA
ncbi:MAG: hypothetical protein J0651_03135, partial [Actinobacteria bacterium]|nr:hypothetical protein [Actinomycetota bacterium]